MVRFNWNLLWGELFGGVRCRVYTLKSASKRSAATTWARIFGFTSRALYLPNLQVWAKEPQGAPREKLIGAQCKAVALDRIGKSLGERDTLCPRSGGQHAERILGGFGGIIQVDGYAGCNCLIAADRIGPGIQLAHSWAHVPRKFFEITGTRTS